MNMEFLQLANKYLEHNVDKKFETEFDYCFGVIDNASV